MREQLALVVLQASWRLSLMVPWIPCTPTPSSAAHLETFNAAATAVGVKVPIFDMGRKNASSSHADSDCEG